MQRIETYANRETDFEIKFRLLGAELFSAPKGKKIFSNPPPLLSRNANFDISALLDLLVLRFPFSKCPAPSEKTTESTTLRLVGP